MSDQDLETFQQIRGGDLIAYERFFKKHYAEVVRYNHRFVRDTVAAEEIAQEVFMYLWEKRETINIQSSLTSYLFQAAKNRSINYLRLELPKLQSQYDISEMELGQSNQSNDTDRTDLVEKLVKQAVDALPKKCKEVFVLSRNAGLTYEEIAEELDLSKKTVENQMSIALKKLRESLKDVIEFVRQQ